MSKTLAELEIKKELSRIEEQLKGNTNFNQIQSLKLQKKRLLKLLKDIYA
ncbi:TPA: hypothetical protein RPW15_001856 [Campylobacter fetus subsp. venerealis]|uniref:Uncharacterized protein n=1 Tax=Campylobacter fetus subsp. venerealis NCTC 10354 TaxID=983328 RepID=A0AAE6IY43_CAMFE|nr:hypothetical protein [Campylobacter fetus]AIR80163.1 hypothetical protein CFV97608_0500 [Campylobacter fetus subsp. venerealis 97/608]MBK3487638.1 hypothetical protein [Campylobacter fetus subsp. venerealis]QEL44479.1 hypothetical protein CFVT_0499 [Campylobacter fetus subsp. venerealis NCTC 10354]QMS61503.1 hypothetical protein GZ988_002985 [Campylobacter fetus]QMS63466.1 hypothetical protein GZ987_002615 [Campylobacter fetus]